MARIRQFEDLFAWQKARLLTRSTYQITQQGAFVRDFGLTSQMQRAAVSIMSNIAEGFERSTSKEFSQYLSIAKASCGELRSQLYVALDVGYINRQDFDQLLTLAQEVSRMLSGLRVAIENRKD